MNWIEFENHHRLVPNGRDQWGIQRLDPQAHAAAASLYKQSVDILVEAGQGFGDRASTHFSGREFLGNFMNRARNAGAAQI